MFLDLLRHRRSNRHFKPTPILPEQVELLLETLLRAPSSRGIRPWHFVVIDDPQLLGALAGAKAHGAEFLAASPLAIAICAEPTASDVWIEDCAIAAILLQMSAEEMGLGSCWAQMRLRFDSQGESAEAKVRKILHLPDDWRVDAIIAIGVPLRRLPGHPRQDLPSERVHRNRYCRS